ncbi:MAG: YlbF family regulator [Eisenbergiella sp.]|uniref:YlbF family regulator n=1 Tax=Eisenbergiella sp. TaxID=1924109 RepID=UPI0039A0922D
MKGCVETMEVQEALEQLAQAVKESEVYREYRRQSERVDNSGDMREKIDEYRVRNFELQNSVQTEDLLDKLDGFEREYEKFREDPLVEEFLDAELAFCRMMQEIDVKLAEAMDFE